MNISKMQAKKEVLIGLANVLEGTHTNLLEGARGAYINIVCYASNDFEFITEATKALNQIGLKLIDIEDIEPISQRARNYVVDDNLMILASKINEKNKVELGVFHTYD